MPEYHGAPKAYEPHALHEDHAKGPHHPKEINPKMASDIAYCQKSSASLATNCTKPFAATEPTWKKFALPFTPTKPVKFATWLHSVEVEGTHVWCYRLPGRDKGTYLLQQFWTKSRTLSLRYLEVRG
jgi:hypothetical protein